MHKFSGKIVFEIFNLEFKSNHRTLLQSINLKIRNGEVLIVTGPSGSGKTTLAKIIARELIPTSGELFFDEDLKIEMVSQQDQFILATGLRTTYYGQRYENPNEEGIPTVADYFRNTVHGIQENQFDGISNELEIETLLQRKLLSLSNGERRRIQLAVAILKKPDMLILDQPFVGLDLHSREKLGRIIENLKSEGTAFVIVSDPAHIPDFADSILELNEGKISRLVLKKEFIPSEKNVVENPSDADTDVFRVLSTQKEDYQFVVRMRNVNVSLGGKSILNNINWEVKTGEQWVLKGQNGAGKTTLLSLITADNPQGYTNDMVLFDRKRGSGESIWDIKKKIGFVSPELHLYFLRKKSVYHPAPGTQMCYNSLTCLDVVLSGLNDEIGFNTSDSERSLRLAKLWLGILDIEHLEKSPFLHSSLGEQRIILLARALIKLPDLLILDEPCQGLDPTQIDRFIKLLDQICEKGKTT
ncbi:MAG TPA: ATP-binding cassette domain-containing protein, partial [Draconibacterium sp.]|nr:ATP-binding cassette domain-containing protein [Draconibacterium sp.]